MCCKNLPTTAWPVAKARSRLYTAPAGEEVEDQHDNGENQKDVDESATHMKAESKEPENEKYDDDCPKHCVLFS